MVTSLQARALPKNVVTNKIQSLSKVQRRNDARHVVNPPEHQLWKAETTAKTPWSGAVAWHSPGPFSQPHLRGLVLALALALGAGSADAACTGAPPVIIQQPMSLNLPFPSSFAQFQVVAASSDPLQYQWQLNGANIPGATAQSLQIIPVMPSDAGVYTVRVFNDCGVVTSQPAFLHLAVPTAPPAQDAFEVSPILSASSGILQGNNAASGTQPDEPLHAGLPGGKSVWYRWRTSSAGVVTLNTQGSAFDTLLAVYTGTSVDKLTQVTFDDDSGGAFTSQVRFNASPNVFYHVAIDGLSGASGDFLFSWSLQVTNKTIPMIQKHPNSIPVASGSNVTFTVTGDVPTQGYQWLFNGEPIPRAIGASYVVVNAGPEDIGLYQVRLNNGPGFETLSFTAALELAQPPETVFQNKFSTLLPPPTPPPTLNLADDLSLGAPPPLAEAALPRSVGFISITHGNSGYDQGNNASADTDLDEPNHCNVPAAHTLWMGLVPNANGFCILDTAGSDVLTHLTLYEFALPISTLDDHLIACDVESAELGLPSTVQFQVSQTKTYVVVIDGHAGVTGNIKLNWRFGSIPPILQFPVCRVVQPGSALELGILDQWVPEPVYQWKLNGQDIPGANTSDLVLNDIQQVKTGTYSVVVSNFLNSVTKTVAHVFLTGQIDLHIEHVPPNQLRIYGAAAGDFSLESAVNLPGENWTKVRSSLGNCQTFDFLIPQLPGEPTRFYRGRLLSP